MKAGHLRFRIEIQEPIETKTTMGETVSSWAFRDHVWGAIDPLRGDEKFTLQQAKPTIDTKITIRGNAAPYLTTKMRMAHRARVFDIDSIIDMGSRGIMKEIYCKEQAA